MKKVLAVISAVVLMTALSACGKQPSVQGGELVRKAQDMYTSLDSARLVISDAETGAAQNTFIYLYTEKDVLNFSFESEYNGKPYYEYYDGKSLKAEREGEIVEYGRFSSTYKKYKRGKDTHPNASAGVLFFEPDCIDDEKTEFDEEVNSYTYYYDMDKLGKVMNLSNGSSTMTSFVTTYCYDSGNDFLMLTETSVMENGDSYSYTVEITERNQISKIQNLIQE